MYVNVYWYFPVFYGADSLFFSISNLKISHYKSYLQHFLIFLISDNKKNIPKDLNKSLLFI